MNSIDCYTRADQIGSVSSVRVSNSPLWCSPAPPQVTLHILNACNVDESTSPMYVCHTTAIHFDHFFNNQIVCNGLIILFFCNYKISFLCLLNKTFFRYACSISNLFCQCKWSLQNVRRPMLV